MAGKRQLSSLDPVIYSKAPRLEAPLEHALTAGLRKPNPMPGYVPEDLLTFKGSYLTYPDASEHPNHWSSTAAYLQYAGNALNQHLRTEGILMKNMLYRSDAESLKTCLPPAEKGRSDIVRDLLIARDKRTSLMGRQDQLRQTQGQTFSLQKPVVMHAAAPSSVACAPLAVPRPIYRNSVCCAEPGYSPRGLVSLGGPMEKVPKQPSEGEWIASSQASSGKTIGVGDQHYATIAAMQRKTQHLETFLQPYPGLGVHTKDAGRMPSEYASLQPSFEQFRAPQCPSFPDARYLAQYESPKRPPDIQNRSPVRKAWPSPHSLTASLLNSQVPSYQDRSPPQSTLATHGQAHLYHQGDPLTLKHTGSAFAPQSPSSYNGFCFPGSTDPRPLPNPRMIPASYLSQQGTGSHYLDPLENYPYRPTNAALNESPVHASMVSASVMPIDPQMDPNIHHSSGYKQDFMPQSSSFAFGPPDFSLYSSPMVDANNHLPQPVTANCGVGVPRVMPPAKESPGVRTTGSQNSAFQPVYTGSGTGKLAEGLLKGDTSYRSSPRQVEKSAISRQVRPMCETRRPSLTTNDPRSRDLAVKEPAMSETIIIDDGTSPQRIKTEACKANITNTSSTQTPSVLSTPPRTLSSSRERRASLNSVQSTSPSSPPMPIINNVFSLAPYRAYLEGTAEHPFAKHQKAVKPSCESSKQAANHLVSEGSSPKLAFKQQSVKNRPETHPPNCSESNTPKWNSPCKRDTEGSIGGGTACSIEHDLDEKSIENHQPEPLPQSPLSKHEQTSEHKNVVQNTSNSQTAGEQPLELPREDEVLDLSLKKTHSLRHWILNPEKAGMDEREGDILGDPQRVAVDTQPKLRMEEACAKPQSLASPVALEKSYHPRAEGGFHSSTAFMFKKYKILKLASSGVAGATQQNNHPVQQILRVPPQPIIQPVTGTSINLIVPNVSNMMPPMAPKASPMTEEAKVPLSSESSCKPGPTSCTQYFTELHLSLCAFISQCIAETCPQVLQEWLKRAGSDGAPKERPKSPVKHRNTTRIPAVPRTSKVREIWLCFEGLPHLLNKVLSQLETYILICKCPFPHVVRAGAIFIPIHLVKETLFPGLSVASIDRVLQEHKVELRPTTLSEEKLLRETELKGCSLRMLKLLALKQLPAIYPDLLDLHWHRCVRQQLGEHNQDKSKDTEKPLEHENRTEDVTTAITKMPQQAVKEKWKKGDFWSSSSCHVAAEQEGEASLVFKESQEPSEEQGGLPSPPHGENVGGTPSPKRETKSLILKLNRLPLPSIIKRHVFQPQKLRRALKLKRSSLSNGSSNSKDYKKKGKTSHVKPTSTSLKKAMARVAKKTLTTAKVLHLRNSVVQIQFQQVLPAPKRAKGPGAGGDCPPLCKPFRQKRRCVERAAEHTPYPELVGKRIRHLYEENDKTEAWYQGLVLGVHQPHPNPLKTVYEVRYDSEPKWRYYLELLQDFENGWLEVDE